MRGENQMSSLKHWPAAELTGGPRPNLKESTDAEKVPFQQKSRLFGSKSRLFGKKKANFSTEKVHFSV
jgi:hypothetical protein